jgi:peptide/nickel transport system permease protein
VTRLRRSLGALLAAGFVVATLASAAGSFAIDHRAYELSGQLTEAPGADHPLGTDQLGRDVLARVVVGARSIVEVAVPATLLAVSLATVVGLLAAVRGPVTDELLMRALDILMSIPELLLAMVLLIALGPSQIVVIAAIGMILMPSAARVFRSSALSLREADFVAAARLRGQSSLSIAMLELLPNLRALILVELAVRFGLAVLLSSALAFLGLGTHPPEPQWGLMVSEGRNYLEAAPWIALVPAVIIGLLVVSVHRLADVLGPARVGERIW